MEFLKAHQLNIMLFLSGVCGVLVVLALISRTLSPRRRRILALIEASGMFLLTFDRIAYLYRGDPTPLGFWNVRISNFMVFFLTLYICHSINLYINDLLSNEGQIESRPIRLLVCEILFTIGLILLIISQFTGLYYTFDSQNRYIRSPGNLICYIWPLSIMMIQLSLVIQYRKKIGHIIATSLLINSLIPITASVLQIFFYGLSLINISIVGVDIFLYIFVLIDLNDKVEQAKIQEIEFYKKEHEHEHELFEQTAQALASAIDAKDKYTHGHSSRVALYSLQIAREAGKSEEECELIYFAALLHDVGKIGIPDTIITKDGKLTNDEFSQIKLHPVYGNQILSRIRNSPYLSIGAHYHHERYDGRGYPEGLKGDDIPEIARIIGVADAYDAMTSKRSYRDPIPQDKVREELVKGMGSQFDPQFARIMQHLIDLDTDYNMKEQVLGNDPSKRTGFDTRYLFDDYSAGILIDESFTNISFNCKRLSKSQGTCTPVLVLFDSLDGSYQDTEVKRRDLLYLEYGLIYPDGRTKCEAARKMEVTSLQHNAPSAHQQGSKRHDSLTHYEIRGVRVEDHLMLDISEGSTTRKIIVAMPDSTRFSYITITGENCGIQDINTSREEEKQGPDLIPRIAEKISFISGCKTGDIPNVEVNKWCSAHSEPIPVSGNLKLTFHALSLPTARLIWHCPYISVFTSKDGKIGGEGYREHVLVRLDGENWESEDGTDSSITTHQTSDFVGWREWKELFKKGLDCEVLISRSDNQISVSSEILGVVVKGLTTLSDDADDIYVALTGDQVGLTDIRIQRL